MTSENEHRLRRELAQTRAELQRARNLIALMEGSRFWKAGRLWERIKRRLRPDAVGVQAAVASPAETPARTHVLPPWWKDVPIRGAALARTNLLVDVVVLARDPLPTLRSCLESIVRATRPPLRLIVLDSAESSEARGYLRTFAEEQGAKLVPGVQALGRVLRSGTSAAIAIVAEPVVVAPDWIDRLLACLDGNGGHAVTMPLFDGIAGLPLEGHGFSDDDVCDVIASESGRLYPEVSALDAPVFLFRTNTLPTTLPEKADGLAVWIREAGPHVLCDDVYVRPTGGVFRNTVELAPNRVLAGIAARHAALPGLRALQNEVRSRWEGRRILFVLPVMDRGGGANVVFSEARALSRMGIDARVLNLVKCREEFEKNYPDCGVPVVYTDQEDVCREGAHYDAVVATSNTSVPWIAPLAGTPHGPVLAYYVQDFEPYFYPLGSAEHAAAWASYELVPGLKLFAKTDWNCRELMAKRGVSCVAIGPSYDAALFRPRISGPAPGPVRIAAMVRPSTPRRQPRFTLEVLREITRRCGNGVEVVIFGVEEGDPQLADLPRDFSHVNLGILDGPRLAALFNQVHVFVDFSSYQAMGLVGLEAMACGTAVVLPRAGGADSFAVHEQNALIVDTSSLEACVAGSERLVRDSRLRAAMSMRGILDVVGHVPDRAAFRMLETLFGPR